MKIPKWLVTSYRLNFPEYTPNRAFNYKKVFVTEMINTDQTKELMHSKGVHTQLKFGSDTNQPNTFLTLRMIPEGYASDERLDNGYLSWYQQYGLNKNSVMTDEFLENAQGQDPNINTRSVRSYKKVFEWLKAQEPSLTARDVNIFGGYGVDNLDKLFDPHKLYESETELLHHVTDRVHYFRKTNDNSWGLANFYSAEHFKYRQANLEYYMYNGKQRFCIPYEILYAKERLSVGTQTYQSQNREVDLVVFATPSVQTLVRNEQGQQIGVEEGRRQNLMQFPNGVLKVYTTPTPIAEVHTMSFWGTLLTRGIIQWGSAELGTDTTKVGDFYEVTPSRWTPTGGTEQVYQPGVNGAPLKGAGGISPYLPTIVDASFAGYRDAIEYVGWTDNLYYANYSSSLKSFTASPGTTGLYNVNGFGPLNYGQISFKKAIDQKKGIALYGTGTGGKSVFYYNAFLNPSEYEDNVIVSFNGESKNLGRVYGRQTAHAKF